jgi:hypothetical protein
MSDSITFTEVTDEDGETVEVYEGEPDDIDRAPGGVQDDLAEDGESS